MHIHIKQPAWGWGWGGGFPSRDDLVDRLIQARDGGGWDYLSICLSVPGGWGLIGRFLCFEREREQKGRAGCWIGSRWGVMKKGGGVWLLGGEGVFCGKGGKGRKEGRKGLMFV